MPKDIRGAVTAVQNIRQLATEDKSDYTEDSQPHSREVETYTMKQP